MSIEPISVRDFLRNFASIINASGKKKYLIMKHGKPIGMFTPWKVVKEETLPESDSPWAILDKF
ncbi:hypothetical protein CO174_02680 [Candidatus Uhrbacteria bacterium CG_4_9_14_3_um_filter_50_9]|uniref:Prevent-host-death protein n=1 Tax=Candidatus Uhrbacteria bacterium CG_4_9_14_3_um_filter_50_9 TaxID=1975035 RepID=A0A2M7XCH8_9BACT|nr:MAG: hypothetical protein CO174_02680 [Candidatus Uhrbacteria bacterium CG_4_9_14_3_um_filter_50_9]